MKVFGFLLGWFLCTNANAAQVTGADPVNPYIESFPPHCDDLLPEDELFTEFLRKATRVVSIRNHKAAMAGLQILAYRDALQHEVDRMGLPNNIGDAIVRAHLCFSFKPEERAGVDTQSQVLEAFLIENEKEISKKILDEVVAILRVRWEGQVLKKEIDRKSAEFRSLESRARSEARSRLDRAMTDAKKSSTRTR